MRGAYDCTEIDPFQRVVNTITCMVAQVKFENAGRPTLHQMPPCQYVRQNTRKQAYV